MHTLEGEIGDRGVVRLLVLLDGFTGWAQTDDWSGLSFYVNHGDQIERIAIVGESRWRDDAMMFEGGEQIARGHAFLTSLKFEQFEPHPEWAKLDLRSRHEAIYLPRQRAGLGLTVVRLISAEWSGVTEFFAA